MYALPADVAVNLGRPLSAAETLQAEQWIAWAEATIARGPAGQPGRNLDELDASTIWMVVVESVSRRLRMPDPVSQQTVSVDDATVTRTYTRASGLIEILPHEWEALGWAPTGAGAFTVTPYGAPDVGVVDAWA